MQLTSKSKYILEKIALTGVPAVTSYLPKGAAGAYLSPKHVSRILKYRTRLREAEARKARGYKSKVGETANEFRLEMNKQLSEEYTPLYKELDSDITFLNKALKKGVLGEAPDTPKWLRRHELTHYLRTKQNKWSSKHYRFAPARLAEEFAAYSAGFKREPGVRLIRYPLAAALSGAQEVLRFPVRSGVKAGIAGVGLYLLKKRHEKKAGLKPFLIAGAIGATAGYLAAPKIRENLTYGTYLTKHKYNVIPPMRQMGLGWGQALGHDLSKLSPSEFSPYRNWFAGPKGISGTRDPETFNKWRTAVQHHYHAPGNLHHYRALGLKQSTVPLKYRMEAVADWYSVQKTKGATHESFPDWYKRLRTKLPLAPETQVAIDERLGLNKSAFAKKIIKAITASRPYKEIGEINSWGKAQHKVTRGVAKVSLVVPIPGVTDVAVGAHAVLSTGTYYGTKLHTKSRKAKAIMEYLKTLPK